MTVPAAEGEALVQAFIQAFRDRDRARCLDCLADDASIRFMALTYRGRETIGQWLDQRFAADAQFVRLESVQVAGDTVTVTGAVTSKKLKAWRMDSTSGRATFRVEAGKIKECRLMWAGPRRKPPPPVRPVAHS